MDSKKGIRLKTKEVSLVDNIVNFFKKEPKDQQNGTLSPQKDLNDASPRSTTPRKKIFNKTPQKAGMINLHKNFNKGPNINNKSIDAEHDLTFNDDMKSFQKLHSKSHLSPSNNKVNYVSKPMEDTHFNKLILGTSNLSTKERKSRTPERTFLSDNNENSKQKNNLNQCFDRKGLVSTLNESSLRKVHQQLENYKRLSEELRAQNIKLKKENRGLTEQVQNLKKVIKSYELSNNNSAPVEIVNLDAPKSPFQKASFNQNKSSPLTKQSILILPETPNQYGNKNSMPKIEQLNFMSSNLRSISNQNSFTSDHSDGSLPNFIKKAVNCQENEKNEIESQFLSPFMQKTAYGKTMKQKDQKSFKQSQINEQNSFSKTVGYLKGDQPIFSAVQKSKNPFQEIATQSNKFFFQQNNHSQSNNSFNVVPGSKGFPTRQWLTFNENESETESHAGQYDNLIALKKQSPFSKVVNPLGKRNQKQKYDENSQNISKQNSASKSKKVDQSRTYKFQDFDLNDEGSSYVDFF